MVRYIRIVKDETKLRARLEDLAAERRRFGFRRLAVLLRRDGLTVNIKQVLCVYREANLQVYKRVRRRVALGRGNPATVVSRRNERWSLDFVHDVLESGCRIRTLKTIDDFSRANVSRSKSTRRFRAYESRVFLTKLHSRAAIRRRS